MPCRSEERWVVILAVLVVLPLARADAQVSPRVVRTLGDATEATCVEAQADALRIGTLGAGVVRLQAGRQERFDAVAGLPGNRVRDCVLHEGVLWVATEEGLCRFEPQAGRFRTLERGRYLRLAAAGSLLLAARGDGVVQRFVHGARADETAALAVASALVAAADGRWALGGVDGALHLGRGARVRRVAIAERAAQPVEPIEQLAIDGDALLATTASHELRVASWRSREPVSPAPRLPAASADRAVPQGVLEHDRARFAGGEAFATDAGVFVRSAPGQPARPLALDGQPCGDRISALAVQGELLWVGSFDRGLCRFDGRDWVQFRAPRELPSDMINALAASADALYVATAQGLVVVDAAGAFTSFTHAQCAERLTARCPWHAAVNGVAIDPASSQVWVADVAAVHRIDPRSGDWHHVPAAAGVRSRNLTRIAAFAGTAAIGTSDHGVYVLRGGAAARAVDDQDGLADNWVTDLAHDARGRLLVATCTRGVSVQDERGAFRTLTARDGLAHDYALSIQEIGGRLWIGTVAGVSIVDGDRITNLTAHDGLSGNEVHDAVAYAGAVWLATDGGLSVVELAPAAAASAAAPVYSKQPTAAEVAR